MATVGVKGLTGQIHSTTTTTNFIYQKQKTKQIQSNKITSTYGRLSESQQTNNAYEKFSNNWKNILQHPTRTSYRKHSPQSSADAVYIASIFGQKSFSINQIF